MALDRTQFDLLVDETTPGTGTIWNKSKIQGVILDPVDADAAFVNASNTFVGDQTIDGDLLVTGTITPLLRRAPGLRSGVNVQLSVSGDGNSGIVLAHDPATGFGEVATANYGSGQFNPMVLECGRLFINTGNPPSEHVVVHPAGGVTIGSGPEHDTDPGVGVLRAKTAVFLDGLPTVQIAVAASNRLLGRGSDGAGPAEEITVGPGLALVGTTLSAPGHTTGSSSYMFNDNTTAPPTGSQVRFNAGYPYSGVTTVWIRDLTNDGVDQHGVLMLMAVGARLYIQDRDDHTRHVRFTVAADPVSQSGYVEFAVTWVEDSGVALPTQQIEVVFTSGPAATTVAAHHATHEPGGSDALAALSASILTTGTLPDARLSVNVARRDQANTFNGDIIVNGGVVAQGGGGILRATEFIVLGSDPNIGKAKVLIRNDGVLLISDRANRGQVVSQEHDTGIFHDLFLGGTKIIFQLSGIEAGRLDSTGVLSIKGRGSHEFIATGAGENALVVVNPEPGAGNYGGVHVGSDVSNTHAVLYAFSSQFAASGPNKKSGVTLQAEGVGGLSIVAVDQVGAIRFYTGGWTEQMRLSETGLLTVNGLGLHVFDASGANTDGINSLRVINNFNGPTTAAQIRLIAGGITGSIDGFAPLFTPTSPTTFASGFRFRAAGAGGLCLGAEHASGVIHFFSGGSVERMRLHASGGLSLGNTVDPGAALLSVSGFGGHRFSGSGNGANLLEVSNDDAAVTDTDVFARVNVRTADGTGLYLDAYGPNWIDNAPTFASGTCLQSTAGRGLSIASALNLRFYTGGGGERMQIAANGHVALNSQPDQYAGAQLQVVAEAAMMGIYARSNQDLYPAIRGDNTVNSSNAYSAFFYNNANGSGQALGNSGAWMTISDGRLKTDIRDLDVLDGLRLIQPRNFQWTSQAVSDDPDRRHFGFIAQEIEAVFPGLITVSPTGHLGVNYDGLIAPLVQGWQDHEARLARLEQLDRRHLGGG